MSNIEYRKENTIRKINSFKDLDCWKQAHSLVIDIYKISSDFPRSEIFGLTSQLRRASVSITSNIAEGFGRQGYREKLQFFYLSRGSLIELENQILISKDVGYITDEKQYDDICDKIVRVQQLLNGIIKSTKKFLNDK